MYIAMVLQRHIIHLIQYFIENRDEFQSNNQSNIVMVVSYASDIQSESNILLYVCRILNSHMNNLRVGVVHK